MKKYAIALYVTKETDSKRIETLHLLFVIADSVESAKAQASQQYSDYTIQYSVSLIVPEEYLNAKIENRTQTRTETYSLSYGQHKKL